MAGIPDTTPLREQWKRAKNKASEEAGKKPEEKATFEALMKSLKGGELGPDLQNWARNYPQWEKLEQATTKITKTIDNYLYVIGHSKLSSTAKQPMTTALDYIRTQMDKNLEQVREELSPKFKKIHFITVVDMDLAKQVYEKVDKKKARFAPKEILVEVTLTDGNVLKHVPADLNEPLLAQQMHDAFGFGRVVKEIAELLMGLKSKDEKAAEVEFNKGLDTIIQESVKRASQPFLDLAKVKVEYRNYKIKKGATLTLAVAGGIASLAVAPLTAGAGTVAAILGILRAATTISREISQLGMQTEQLAKKIRREINDLKEQYKKSSAGTMGAGEVGKAFGGSLIGPVFTSIKTTKEDLEQFKQKINGLEQKAHLQSRELGKVLQKQSLLRASLKEFDEKNKGKLHEDVAKLRKALQDAVDATESPIDATLTGVSTLVERVRNNRETGEKLEKPLEELAGKEPTWAKVGEILIPVLTSIGSMVAGGLSGSEEILETAKLVLENTERAVKSVETVKEAFFDIKELVDDQNKEAAAAGVH